jgi:hypothetical protein
VANIVGERRDQAAVGSGAVERRRVAFVSLEPPSVLFEAPTQSECARRVRSRQQEQECAVSFRAARSVLASCWRSTATPAAHARSSVMATPRVGGRSVGATSAGPPSASSTHIDGSQGQKWPPPPLLAGGPPQAAIDVANATKARRRARMIRA